MYPRTEYEMSKNDLAELLDAFKPVPVMFISGGQSIGGSQQENANYAWEKLGKKMGFDYMTVRPIDGKGMQFFTAVPSETIQQRQDRETKEAEEKRLSRIEELKKEIENREDELKGLTYDPR